MKHSVEACAVCSGSETKLKFASRIKTPACAQDFVGTNRGYAVYHDIVECLDCAHVYMRYRDDDWQSLLSDVADPLYLESASSRVPTFRKLLRAILDYKNSGVLLDVGCYAGLFLKEADRYFKCTGVEPSAWACQEARRIVPNAEIVHSPIEQVELDQGAYDVISLWDVIEHVGDPALTLRKSYEALKPGGIMAITTHDIRSGFARLAGPRYPWLMRFHFNHFSRSTLKRLCEQMGFEILKIAGFNKPFSIEYLAKQVAGKKVAQGLSTLGLGRVKVAIPTGDFFILIAKKPNS